MNTCLNSLACKVHWKAERMAENAPLPPKHCAGAEQLKAALSLHGADWVHLFCSQSTASNISSPISRWAPPAITELGEWASLYVLTQQQDPRGQIQPRLTELSAPITQINESHRVTTPPEIKNKIDRHQIWLFLKQAASQAPGMSQLWQPNCYLSVTGLNNFPKLLTQVTLFKAPRLSHDAALPQHNSSVMKWAQFILPFVQFPLSYGKATREFIFAVS